MGKKWLALWKCPYYQINAFGRSFKTLRRRNNVCKNRKHRVWIEFERKVHPRFLWCLSCSRQKSERATLIKLKYFYGHCKISFATNSAAMSLKIEISRFLRWLRETFFFFIHFRAKSSIVSFHFSRTYVQRRENTPRQTETERNRKAKTARDLSVRINRKFPKSRRC